MTKRKSKKGSRKSLLITLCVVAAVVAAIVWALFFHAMSKGGERYIYISPKDKLEDVYDKLRPISNTTSFAGFRLLASVTGYGKDIRPGRYSVDNPNSSNPRLY